jgi:two-component system, sensor histidine kinase and response regulator
MTDLPLVDPTALRRLVSWGGEPLLDRMIELFGEVGTKRLAQIRAGLAEGDLEEVGQAAHSLKSSAGNLGADRLRQFAQMLESGSAAGSPDEVARLAGLVQASYHETVTELARLRTLPLPRTTE